MKRKTSGYWDVKENVILSIIIGIQIVLLKKVKGIIAEMILRKIIVGHIARHQKMVGWI